MAVRSRIGENRTSTSSVLSSSRGSLRFLLVRSLSRRWKLHSGSGLGTKKTRTLPSTSVKTSSRRVQVSSRSLIMARAMITSCCCCLTVLSAPAAVSLPRTNLVATAMSSSSYWHQKSALFLETTW